MRRKTKVLEMILVLAIMLSLCSGCGNTASSSSDTSSIGESTKQTTDMGEEEKKIVTDVFGREVELPETINSVAALGSAARLVVYAGGTNKLTGITKMELKGNSGMPYAYANADIFSKCQVLASGGSGNEDYTEAIVSLNPDVIFYNDSDTVAIEDLAKKTNIPVIGVYGDAFNSDTFLNSLTLIGEVLGTEEHANQVVSSIRSWIEDLNNRTKDIAEEDKPKVYLGAVSWSGGHGFVGTYADYAPLQAINAINLADELDATNGFEVDMEQIIKWDPDVIFLNPSNMELVNEDYEKNGAAIDSLRAVKDGKIYAQVNFNYYWCNMELAIVDSYYAGSILYPEAFADIDFNEKAEEIFNTMIGRDYLQVLNDNGFGFSQMKIGE